MGSLNSQSIVRAAEQLAATDRTLKPVLQRLGPPPLWKRPSTFATFVRIILEQQVSLQSAKSTFDRLAAKCGSPVSAAAVAEIGEAGLRELGFSRQKARYVEALAQDVLQGRFRIAALRHRDDQDVREQVTQRLGLGDWSADVFFLMALGRPDVFPVGDLALVKGMSMLDDREYGSPEELLDRAECWRPFRSVATRMIWQLYLDRNNQPIPK